MASGPTRTISKGPHPSRRTHPRPITPVSATERSIFFIENDGSPHTIRGAESTGPIMDGHSAPAQSVHGAGIHPQALPKGAMRVWWIEPDAAVRTSWHPGPSTSATGQSSHVADAGSASLETDIASWRQRPSCMVGGTEWRDEGHEGGAGRRAVRVCIFTNSYRCGLVVRVGGAWSLLLRGRMRRSWCFTLEEMRSCVFKLMISEVIESMAFLRIDGYI